MKNLFIYVIASLVFLFSASMLYAMPGTDNVNVLFAHAQRLNRR